jgi:hypothetical protein
MEMARGRVGSYCVDFRSRDDPIRVTPAPDVARAPSDPSSGSAGHAAGSKTATASPAREADKKSAGANSEGEFGADGRA